MTKTDKTGAQKVRWNLTDLYNGVKDPKLDADLARVEKMGQDFPKKYKGKLAKKLSNAVADWRALGALEHQLAVYCYLMFSCNTKDDNIQQRRAQVSEALAKVAAATTFFSIEVGAMAQADYDRQVKASKVLQLHKPMLDHTRALAKYQLSEDVETALAKRQPFGPSEWGEYMDELEAEATFKVGKEKLSLTQILHELTENKDAKVRRKLLKIVNNGLAKQMARPMARALNVTMGDKLVDDEDRGFTHPMSATNLGNKVSDEVVNALHEAVRTEGAVFARRYYKLLAKWLKKPVLAWSDRNARPDLPAKQTYSWEECVSTVLGAYRAFSPTLADLLQSVLDDNRVDAADYPGKQGGAYCYSLESEKDVRTHIFMSYLGSVRDVMTFAHEGGHGVHGLLAGRAVGGLQLHAPMVYAETASIFGEMMTFEHLYANAKNDTDRLALLFGKMGDHLNSVVRQISFSLFEQKAFAARKNGKLKVEDFNRIWGEVTKELYGKNGKVFTYDNTEYLWSYVGHFLRPFYVYAYAFGELLTQSLYAVKDQVPDFEAKYLDLLRAGDTKDAVELLKPFGLDPTDPSFWAKGIRNSMGKWIKEAEKLSAKMNYKAPKKKAKKAASKKKAAPMKAVKKSKKAKAKR